MSLPPSNPDAEKLALDILKLSRNTLLIHLRFLEPALCEFQFMPNPESTLETDGINIYYNFLYVLKSYRIQKELVMHDYLHMVLHCIFHHPFIGDSMDSQCWDLACDIAAEAVIADLQLPCTTCQKQKNQERLLSLLNEALPSLTAERIYHYLLEQELSAETLVSLREAFFADEHELWYQHSKTQKENKEANKNEEPQKNHSDSSDSNSSPSVGQKNESKDKHSAPSKSDEEIEAAAKPPQPDRGESQERWKDISSKVQTDLETFSQNWGEKAGSLLQNIRECNRERCDYKEFLKQFAVFGEVLHPSDEEFDYIYYTYGLQLYQNMPLIEPLEYQESKRIREFAIAIDTSASVDGELVRIFLRKTYNILKQSESYFTKINLHIIQCDTKIQEDIKISSEEELEHYLNHLTLKGFGGTDFRPVFQYVDELIQKREFLNLKGLLYFTDGNGTYPALQPEYKTAFIFIENHYEERNVPVWAIKLILEEDELKNNEAVT